MIESPATKPSVENEPEDAVMVFTVLLEAKVRVLPPDPAAFARQDFWS